MKAEIKIDRRCKEYMTPERKALCSELGRKAALAKLAKKHARDTLAADALKYFVPAMLLLVEVEADGVLSEQLERKVKQICNNFFGDVRPIPPDGKNGSATGLIKSKEKE